MSMIEFTAKVGNLISFLFHFESEKNVLKNRGCFGKLCTRLFVLFFQCVLACARENFNFRGSFGEKLAFLFFNSFSGEMNYSCTC